MNWWQIILLILGVVAVLFAAFIIWVRWWLYGSRRIDRPPMGYSQYLVANEVFLEEHYEKAKEHYPEKDDFLFVAYLGYLRICRVDKETIDAIQRLRGAEGHEKAVEELDKPFL